MAPGRRMTRRVTRGEAWGTIGALAAGLQALGVSRGERVATLLPACLEAAYPLFLPGLLGTVNVPLNPLLREPELRAILADCEASVVITAARWYGQDFPALLARLQPELPALRTVIVCDAEPSTLPSGQLPFEAVATPRPLHRAALSSDDLTLISYTSGTTGQIKGVAHTRRRTLGLLPRALGVLAQQPLRCLLTPFPPFHFAGTFSLVSTLLAGGKVVLVDRFDPRAILESIERERVTHVAAAPTLYRWLLRTPELERYDLRSLRRVTFSTEPCPPDLAEELHS
ncbi:MAG TPA: class I adenylate-forming enzyme family protein, partial [Anaerolineae bacterium]|nr:class I adenylate-forming enzyme family protein [Anaerolineae bacterium]